MLVHCLVGRVFANGPEDLGSILGRVIPTTLKMVLYTSLLNTQQYKVRIKGIGNAGSLTRWVEYSPMVRGSWVQSQVASYKRLLKWYLIHPCLTPSNIRCVSRAKWSNPGKGVAPSPTPQCNSYWKWNLLVALDYFPHLYFTFLETKSFKTVSK